MLNRGQEGPFERTKKNVLCNQDKAKHASSLLARICASPPPALWACGERAMHFYRDCHHGARGLILLFQEEKIIKRSEGEIDHRAFQTINIY